MSELKEHKTTGYVQWDVYNVIRNAFCLYRNIKLTTSEITKDQFIKNMQFDNYIKLTGEKDKKNIVIAILARNEKGTNEIAIITEKFRLFINSIKTNVDEIIIVSPCKFPTHVLKLIYDMDISKKINRYYYDHFKIVVPLGPYCSKHTILSIDETKEIIEQHNLVLKEMKKIYTTDSQIVWIGAQVGQIVRIDRINVNTGKSTDYRRVVAGIEE